MNIQNHNQQSCEKLSITMVPASYNVKKLFYTILFTLYFALMLISFIWNIDIIIFINWFLGLFALILLSTRIRREHIPIYIYVGLLWISTLVTAFFVGRTPYFPSLFIVPSFGIAMILLRGYVYSWGGYIVFYSLTIYYLSFMLSGAYPLYVLKFSSWNGISMTMLLACISLYVILYMENKKIDLKPALFTAIISSWAIGRSGILSSFVLLCGLIFHKFRGNPKYIVIIYLFVFSLFYFFASLFYDLPMFGNIDYSFFGSESVNTISYFKIAMEKEESARWVIWVNYFNNLDIFRVIFGVNVFEDPWPSGLDYAYNYHNSFILLHSQTGFMGLITLALIILSLFKFYRINIVFFILLLTLILRSFSDVVIFFNRFDFVPFFFIFYFLSKRPVNPS